MTARLVISILFTIIIRILFIKYQVIYAVENEPRIEPKIIYEPLFVPEGNPEKIIGPYNRQLNGYLGLERCISPYGGYAYKQIFIPAESDNPSIRHPITEQQMQKKSPTYNEYYEAYINRVKAHREQQVLIEKFLKEQPLTKAVPAIVEKTPATTVEETSVKTRVTRSMSVTTDKYSSIKSLPVTVEEHPIIPFNHILKFLEYSKEMNKCTDDKESVKVAIDFVKNRLPNIWSLTEEELKNNDAKVHKFIIKFVEEMPIDDEQRAFMACSYQAAIYTYNAAQLLGNDDMDLILEMYVTNFEKLVTLFFSQ